jgi:glycosyltransferase involved in cell wall biosynthesis
MQILALIATYNEERFIAGCLEHLFAQGVEAYLCDNQSTDATVAIASRYLGSGLRGIETIPRDGVYRWRNILRRKESLTSELSADWFLHLDADEIPLAAHRGQRLVDAVAAADAGGWNAMQFSELTFVPTREDPDHDHSEFRRTMRWYYAFAPRQLHLVRAWKRQSGRIDLASSGGHVAAFEGRSISPESGRMCHYLFLSRGHAVQKYVHRAYDPAEVRDGWHGWRATITAETIQLPSRSQLKTAGHDGDLDVSSPRTEHCVLWSDV